MKIYSKVIGPCNANRREYEEGKTYANQHTRLFVRKKETTSKKEEKNRRKNKKKKKQENMKNRTNAGRERRGTQE